MIQSGCVQSPLMEESAVVSEALSPNRPPSLRSLALAFLKLGAIGFGGGMAIIALMEDEFVRKRRAIDSDEFLHGVGLSQVLGPFAVNTALFTGYRLYGAVGGLVSACLFIAPSLVLVLVLSWLYFEYHAVPALQNTVAGLGPIVIGLILSAGWSMGRKALRSWLAFALCTAATVAGLYKVNPVYVLAASGVLGLVLGHQKLSARTTQQNPAIAPDAHREEQRLPFGAVLGFLGFQGMTAAGRFSLAQLGLTFLKVGLVFFGGGFVLIPVLYQTLVLHQGWLTAQEFIDGVAISNLTPGPISVLATFAGYRVQGISGALVATLALYLPAIVLMLILCYQYERLKDRTEVQAFLTGIVPAVIGLILSTAILLGATTLLSWRSYAFALFTLLLLIKWKVPPVWVLALGAAAGTMKLLP
jgi:chromate transporter